MSPGACCFCSLDNVDSDKSGQPRDRKHDGPLEEDSRLGGV